MLKLKLKLEELKVSSFETDAAPDASGTVHAQSFPPSALDDSCTQLIVICTGVQAVCTDLLACTYTCP